MKIRITHQARADLHALHRLVEDSNTAAADDMLESVLDSMARLRDVPRMGRVGRIPGTRELVVTGTPILVAYELDHEVRILRVLHGRMEWPERL